jgi:hypothetical protein
MTTPSLAASPVLIQPEADFPDPAAQAVSVRLDLVLAFGAIYGQKANDNGRRGKTDHFTRAGRKHHGLIDVEFMAHRRTD